MASVSFHIMNLLEKMSESDKDYRFMATNDLMTELQKDSIKLDDDTERKIVKQLLKLLEDKNGEVQNLAVKCLGPLVGKVREHQLEYIVDALCANMLSQNEQLRDISSIGLKTVIFELPTAQVVSANVCRNITGKLIIAIQQEDVSVQLESLEILADVLTRFGPQITSYHGNIQEALRPLLSSPRMAVRKRAIIALSQLVVTCTKSLFDDLILYLLEELSKNVSMQKTRTYVQCLASISRQAGQRIGEYLQRILPLIIKFSRNANDDELTEYCIQACESFVRRCPKEITGYIDLILEICQTYLTYDPNYNYGDEDNEFENGAGGLEDDDEDSEADYSDDDDVSWKVRRAAAKTLAAVITTRHELVSAFYDRGLSLLLVSRFKEREENVKGDIFNCYICLLRQTRPVAAAAGISTSGATSGGDADTSMDIEGPVQQLIGQVAQLVKAIHKELSGKSIKTRQLCFQLLAELVTLCPGVLDQHLDHFIQPGLQLCLSEKASSSNMKIDTLVFLSLLLSTHSPLVCQPLADKLVPLVLAAVRDPFYKIISEALNVLEKFVIILRPLDGRPSVAGFDFQPYVVPLYESAFAKLKAADIDQEVKEKAISCMGQIISTFGDLLETRLEPQCLPVFLERLKNEITRLATVRALSVIAQSPLQVNITYILKEGIPILASFLRKNQRALKLATLTCLAHIVRQYNALLEGKMVACVLIEVPNLLLESDLHVTQLTLNLLNLFSQVHSRIVVQSAPDILPPIQKLIMSSLVQGSILDSVILLLTALMKTGNKDLSFNELYNFLTTPCYQQQQQQAICVVHRQSIHNISRCVARLSVESKYHTKLVPRLIEEVTLQTTATVSETVVLYSLFTVGEIGRLEDVSGVNGIPSVILRCFDSSNEEIKAAASFALGALSLGNLPQFLPLIINELKGCQPKQQYLLLHSLKEIITSPCSDTGGAASANARGSTSSANGSTTAAAAALVEAQEQAAELLRPHLPVIWDLLLTHADSPEEGTRNVAAECLGKLTLLSPQYLLGQLVVARNSSNPLTRSTAVTAVKFTISDKPQKVDAYLEENMHQFLSTMRDEDIFVRRVALVTFNSAAHNKPSLIRPLLPGILADLYAETKIKPELIREVEMGPFKHSVDDGLDTRKAAFECMYTLLDSCMDRLDIFEFLQQVESGLKDHYDIKMLTFLMLIRLSTINPHAVLQNVEHLVEALRSTCMQKAKANAVKQELEKNEELKKFALRTVEALARIPDADKNNHMKEFLGQIRQSAELSAMYANIQEAAGASSTSGGGGRGATTTSPGYASSSAAAGSTSGSSSAKSNVIFMET